jgi:hypothetical protein
MLRKSMISSNLYEISPQCTGFPKNLYNLNVCISNFYTHPAPFIFQQLFIHMRNRELPLLMFCL